MCPVTSSSENLNDLNKNTTQSTFLMFCLFVCFFLQIQKFGDPNGIVQFAPESLTEKNYTEPSAAEGPQSITLFVRRIQGTLGNITVFSLFP